jgi:hypothetical protein
MPPPLPNSFLFLLGACCALCVVTFTLGHRWELITQKIPYSDEKLRAGPAGLAQLYSYVVEEKKRLQVLFDLCSSRSAS